MGLKQLNAVSLFYIEIEYKTTGFMIGIYLINEEYLDGIKPQ